MQLYTVYFICKLLYMFRMVSPPIIGSTNNCIYSIWYYQPLLLPVAIVEELRRSPDSCKYSYLCS